LAAAACASLHVTSLYVNFAFYHSTIMARPRIRSPVIWLITVANAIYFFSVHYAGILKLCSSNLIWPSRNHRYASMDYFLLFFSHAFTRHFLNNVRHPSSDRYWPI
jgi:hypothetical protein